MVPAGDLTLERLAQQPEDSTGAVHYLKIPTPKEGEKRGCWARLRAGARTRDPDWPRETFRAGRGRLARVGYISRLADALFSLTLLARGRVPGGDVEGGRVLYGRLMEEEERFRYHGHVVRQDGWIVLQYWLFYAFNDWRSNFFGANDHEADWEKVFVYLSESESGDIRPEWVAYAAHEETGDDLRRRWDDPELEKIGEHPVATSALARTPAVTPRGEYLTELEFPLPRAIAAVRRVARSFWYRTLRQYADEYYSGEALRTVHHPLRGLWARGRVVCRTGSGQGVGPPAPHESAADHGFRVTGGCGASTRVIPSKARTPLRDRCTTAIRPSAGSGSTRWAGPGSTRCRTGRRNSASSPDARRRSKSAAIASAPRLQEKSSRLKALGMDAEATRDRSHLSKLHENQTRHIEELSREVETLRAATVRRRSPRTSR